MKNTENISIQEFLNSPGPILDVRSPVEFQKGHIPGAKSFPLFSDKERELVGICFKKEGRQKAIELGLEMVGPRIAEIAREASEIAKKNKIRIHCWRGGMRSESVSWLLRTAGLDTVKLAGGYKSYRNWARGVVSTPRNIMILGGFTGSGKTQILNEVRNLGGQSLDLEGLANHRGSSFGGLGMPDQPTTQHFENLIAAELAEMDPQKPLWIEAESCRVGTCWIPEELFRLMGESPKVEISRPIGARLDILTEMYGDCDRSALVEATLRIARRLGGERTKQAIQLIESNDLREASRLILDYYDRSYRNYSKAPVSTITPIDVGNLVPRKAAELLLRHPFPVNPQMTPKARAQSPFDI